MPIEVELRSFIDKETYEELEKFFHSAGTEYKNIFQETTYYNGVHSLRTVRSDDAGKIVLKTGALHGEEREELEIHLATADVATAERILMLLGYIVECKWFRKRQYWLYKGISICLDDTKGYGFVLEIDRVTEEKDKDEALEALHHLMQEINIPVTPKEVFEKKYEHYVAHWEELTK